MKIDPETMKPTELIEYYLHLFQLMAQAPRHELDLRYREWFAQFNELTWFNQEHFIDEFPQLGMNFGILASQIEYENACSGFVLAALKTIACHMLEDLHTLSELGYYIKAQNE
jgi:hypothetical protein